MIFAAKFPRSGQSRSSRVKRNFSPCVALVYRAAVACSYTGLLAGVLALGLGLPCYSRPEAKNAEAGMAPEAVGSKDLQIYFIDVEGGQATLFVTPAGQSLLIDTGWGGNNGRDAERIVAAAKNAGISKIDYVLITH